MSLRNSELEAIKDFEKLFELLKRNPKSDVGKSFRTRCREMPNLIDELGFVPAMTFCYAKSTHKNYQDIVKAFKQNEHIEPDESTKKGYAVYLFLVLNRLQRLNLLLDKDVENPLSALERLSAGRSWLASKSIRVYLLQLKKLSEAVFESEESSG